MSDPDLGLTRVGQKRARSQDEPELRDSDEEGRFSLGFWSRLKARRRNRSPEVISGMLIRLECLLQEQLYIKAWGMPLPPSMSAYDIVVELSAEEQELAVYNMLLRSVRSLYIVHLGGSIRRVVRNPSFPAELREVIFQTWLALRTLFGRDVAFNVVDHLYRPSRQQLEQGATSLMRSCAYLNRFWVPCQGLPWGDALLSRCCADGSDDDGSLRPDELDGVFNS